MNDLPTATLIHGDVESALGGLSEKSVHVAVTSPPYFQLRSYGAPAMAARAGGVEIGQEVTVAEYIDNLVRVFEGVRRVLRDDGTLWLNIGDTYARRLSRGRAWKEAPRDKPVYVHGGKTPSAIDCPAAGLKDKDLIGVPWRLALALQAAGWYLRADFIWHKPNPIPTGFNDRPVPAHEYLFLLTKSARYVYNPVSHRVETGSRERDVLTIAHEGMKENHFAAFPTKLARTALQLGLAGRYCGGCGAAYRAHVERERFETRPGTESKVDAVVGETTGHRDRRRHCSSIHLRGWVASCGCPASPGPGTVLDPFCGSGRSGVAALGLGHNYLGIDCNLAYLDMASSLIGRKYPKVSLTRNEVPVGNEDRLGGSSDTPERGNPAEQGGEGA